MNKTLVERLREEHAELANPRDDWMFLFDAADRIEELGAENQDLRDSKADMLANHIHATAELQSRIDAALKLADEWDATAGDPGTNLVRFDCANELREALQSAGGK